MLGCSWFGFLRRRLAVSAYYLTVLVGVCQVGEYLGDAVQERTAKNIIS